MQAEEVFVWTETVTKSLVWMICLYCFRFWSLSFSKRSLCVLLQHQEKLLLIMYVDDIIVTDDDAQENTNLKC